MDMLVGVLFRLTTVLLPPGDLPLSNWFLMASKFLVDSVLVTVSLVWRIRSFWCVMGKPEGEEDDDTVLDVEVVCLCSNMEILSEIGFLPTEREAIFNSCF